MTQPCPLSKAGRGCGSETHTSMRIGASRANKNGFDVWELGLVQCQSTLHAVPALSLCPVRLLWYPVERNLGRRWLDSGLRLLWVGGRCATEELEVVAQRGVVDEGL